MKQLRCRRFTALLFGMCLFALPIILSGCTNRFNQASGPMFSMAALQKPGYALIYIYRPPIETGGFSKTYFVADNGNAITNLKHGGYYPYETKTGRVSLSAISNIDSPYFALSEQYADLERTKKRPGFLTFKVMAGEIYYVKFRRLFTAWGRPKPIELLLMPNIEADKEIQNCKLITF